MPWLLAFATVVLAFGRRLTQALRLGTPGPAAILAGQFVLSIYGGYFGGAVGLMMLAFWTATTSLDPARGQPAARHPGRGGLPDRGHRSSSSPPTSWLSRSILVALLAGAVFGGYAGAHLVRRLPAAVLRTLVLTTAVAMTALFFIRAFG